MGDPTGQSLAVDLDNAGFEAVGVPGVVDPTPKLPLYLPASVRQIRADTPVIGIQVNPPHRLMILALLDGLWTGWTPPEPVIRLAVQRAFHEGPAP